MSLRSSDYTRRLTEELDSIREKWSYSTRYNAFVHWCLRLVSNTDDDELCGDSYTDGPNDLGVDGIMIAEGDPTINQPNIIYFVQAKLGEKVDRKDIREFAGNVIKLLKEPGFAQNGNPNIIRLSGGREIS